MLIGQFISKLTDKDRISVPKKYRTELGDELVVARWYEKCLVLVSLDGWRTLQERLKGEGNLITSPVRNIDRFVLGLSYEVSLDAQGRFIVPTKLLEHAEIKDEVVFLGLGDRVEIWSAENWSEFENKIEERANAAIERIAKR
jgi:MraZ protein